jgi:lysozyme family protein
MAEFEKAVEVVLQRECGFVDHPADRGGATNFGISQRSYPDLDIRSLTREQATAIYQRDFWREEYDRIPLQTIATKLFDSGVNMGQDAAVRILQQALCDIRFAVEIDGRFGPQTLQAVKLACHARLMPLLAAWRARLARHYVDLILRDQSQVAFLDGWLRRAVA